MAWQDDPVVYQANSAGQQTRTSYSGTLGFTGTEVYQRLTPEQQFITGNVYGWVPVAQPALAGPGNVSAATGVSPLETSYSLYGHVVPLSVFGVGRIGGEIIAGPWIENGLASFIISFGVPADPSGTRTLREIAFDSQVVWTNTGGFSSEAFTFRFYGGTLTQAADALETTHFGVNAVAYRPQILLAFENLPLANTKFKKIPYVAAVIADATGDDVNLGEAFERLAYSPWVGFTSSQFDTTGITDGLVSGGLIFTQDVDFLAAIQLFGRFYPNWSIIQTDKLRIIDRGTTVTADIVLTTTTLLGDVAVNRQGADTVPKTLELSTIDPGADYTIVPFRATLPHDPVAVTTSIGTDTSYLPAIMDASTRASIATFAKYNEELTRKTVSGITTAYGLEIEPGDLIQISDLGDDFSNDIFRVTDTLHGINYTVEFTARPFMRCGTNICGWDPATTFHVTLSNNNLTATHDTLSNGTVRAVTTMEKSSGKYYFEITWSVMGGFLIGGAVGVATSTASFTDLSSYSANTTMLSQGGFDAAGKIFAGGSYTGKHLGGTGITGPFLAAGDVIGMAVDLTNHKMWFKVVNRVLSGGFWNGDAAADPATDTGGVAVPMGLVMPVGYFNANHDVYIANFGSSAFTGTVPSGFTSGWPCT